MCPYLKVWLRQRMIPSKRAFRWYRDKNKQNNLTHAQIHPFDTNTSFLQKWLNPNINILYSATTKTAIACLSYCSVLEGWQENSVWLNSLDIGNIHSIFLNWNMVDLEYSVGFRCTASDSLLYVCLIFHYSSL